MAEPSRTAEAVEAGATLPLPAFRRRLLQVASPAGPTALGGANPAARAVRRLMVTPWFAVATGFVVAAGLWVYSPHAELRFPNGAVGEVPCKKPSDCQLPSTQNRGVPASSATLPITSAVKSAGRIPTSRPRHLTYRVFWQSQGRFAMLISLSGKHVPRTWRLTFALPGDDIIGVDGAGWKATGSDEGTVTWPAADASGQTPGPAGDGSSGTAPWAKAGAGFVVVAAGAPIAPIDCSFNGATCKFSFAPAAAGQTTPTGP
jgi:hypothetical protein